MRRLCIIATALVLCLAIAVPVAAADPVRPFKGWGGGADSYGPPTGCDAGAGWRYRNDGTGQMTHLGRVTVVVEHCTYPSADMMTGSFGPGTITMTAANGDQLVLEEHGTFRVEVTDRGPVSYPTLTWHVISGTGRFANAEGEGGASIIGVIADNTSYGGYWGWISY